MNKDGSHTLVKTYKCVTFGFSEIDNPDSLKNYFGWTGTFGLPRSLWLGSDGTLRMRPVKELEVTIRPGNAIRYGVKVCVSDDGREETIIYYDTSDRKLKFDTRKSGLEYGRKIIEEAPLELKKEEPLVLRIFVDKSIVEVFANDRQAIGRVVYPTLMGMGIRLFSEGGNIEVKSLKTWKLSPSNPY